MNSAFKLVQPDRLAAIVINIAKTRYSSMQYSDRCKDEYWRQFAVLTGKVLKDGHRLRGHISNPSKKDIKFEITVYNDGKIEIDIEHFGQGFEVAVEILKQEFPRFYKRSKELGKPGGGGGDLEGIYLWGGQAKTVGLLRLKEAVAIGMFSQGLADTAAKSGITARKFKAKSLKTAS